MPKPVTVDLLHPTVVRAFTNWGYISFFGCIAALITLLFFAIGQVKQADEAGRVVRQPAQTNSGIYIGHGFQIDYKAFLNAADIAQSPAQVSAVGGGYQGIHAIRNVDGSMPGLTVNFVVKEKRYTGTLQDYKLERERDAFCTVECGPDASTPRYVTGLVNVAGIEMVKTDGGYGDIAAGRYSELTYSFIRDGYLVTVMLFGRISENETNTIMNEVLATLVII